MVGTRSKSRAVVHSRKGKRSGGRKARTTHYNALPESVRGSTRFYKRGSPGSRLRKIAKRGSKRRTQRQTARHITSISRHGRPTHYHKDGTDKRKHSAYCLRKYKS
jgi:hypothetical protein